MNSDSERSCTAHRMGSAEAETEKGDNGCTYIVLRCVVCNRPQGLRLVRKVKP